MGGKAGELQAPAILCEAMAGPQTSKYECRGPRIAVGHVNAPPLCAAGPCIRHFGLSDCRFGSLDNQRYFPYTGNIIHMSLRQFSANTKTYAGNSTDTGTKMEAFEAVTGLCNRNIDTTDT